MMRLAVREARDHFADIINRVIYAGERVVIERRGKDAVITSYSIHYTKLYEDCPAEHRALYHYFASVTIGKSAPDG